MATVVKPPRDDGRPVAPVEPRRETAPRPERSSRTVIAFILIGLGIYFLALQLVALGGGWLFVTLGAAFLVGRILTKRYGLAVPAGVLLGFGAFVAAEEGGWLAPDPSGWFFVFLGLGFFAVYVIGGRLQATWPLIPGAALTLFGILLRGDTWLAPLAPYAWITWYWPVTLLAFGAWLLVGHRLPDSARTSVGAIGLILLVLYGLLAVGAALAASPFVGEIPSRIVAPGVVAPFATEIRLDSSIGTGDTFRVLAASEDVRLRPGVDGQVHVTATIASWWQDPQADIRLTSVDGVLTLQRYDRPRAFSPFQHVVYTIQVPAATRTEIHTASGDVSLQDLTGEVAVETRSGDVTATSLAGPVVLRTTSGDVRVDDLRGELIVATSSGDVGGSKLFAVREVTTSSGAVSLAGSFDDNTRIVTNSGDVSLWLTPTSSARVDVTTSSGDISVTNLPLANQRLDRHSLSGMLGDGEGTLRVQTSSGDVRLAAGSE